MYLVRRKSSVLMSATVAVLLLLIASPAVAQSTCQFATGIGDRGVAPNPLPAAGGGWNDVAVVMFWGSQTTAGGGFPDCQPSITTTASWLQATATFVSRVDPNTPGLVLQQSVYLLTISAAANSTALLRTAEIVVKPSGGNVNPGELRAQFTQAAGPSGGSGGGGESGGGEAPPPPPPSLDLTVQRARPVQVVFDAPIVKGKATAVEVEVRASNVELVSTGVLVHATVGNQTLAAIIPAGSFSRGSPGTAGTAKVMVHGFQPQAIGSNVFFVEINPGRATWSRTTRITAVAIRN